jgi:hypothetical protein
MAFATGQVLAADDLNDLLAYDARYSRASGTQAVANATDTQVQFPTATRTSTFVTASGTNNNAFTLAEGLWIVTSTIRFSASHLSTELSVAEGSTTWAFANVIAGVSAGINLMVATTVYVPDGTTTAVTLNAYQVSGGSLNLTALGGGTGMNVSFTRVGTRAG